MLYGVLHVMKEERNVRCMNRRWQQARDTYVPKIAMSLWRVAFQHPKTTRLLI